jgi:hypothetical protein
MLAAAALLLLGSTPVLFAQNIVTDPGFELAPAASILAGDSGLDNVDPAQPGVWEAFANIDHTGLFNATAGSASTPFVFAVNLHGGTCFLDDVAATPIQAPRSSSATFLLAGLAFVGVRARWQRVRFLLRMAAEAYGSHA